MRYSARWSNGFWKLFDSVRFEDVRVLPRQVDAQTAADERNALFAGQFDATLARPRD